MSSIQESIDVAVPVRTAYEEWTRFAASGATDAARDPGAVAFQPLDEARTRVVLQLEYDPGTAERMGDDLEVARRRARDDLERFREITASGGSGAGSRGDDMTPERVVGDPTAEAIPAAADPDATEPRGGAAEPAGWAGGDADRSAMPAVGRLRGLDVLDPDGEKVGRVADVYLDPGASRVRYLAVRTGWLAGKRHVVPVDDVTYAPGPGDPHITVPYTRGQLRSGPSFNEGDDLTPEDERTASDYYSRIETYDAAREAVRARQTAPAPTPQIAEAEAAEAIRRGEVP